MNLNDIVFSVHEYDMDGDISEAGVFLHFGLTRVKVASSADEFEEVARRINGMVDEIRENYQNV